MVGKPFLEFIGDLVQIIGSIVTTLTVIIGGIFAWRRWGREDPEAKRADLTQEIEHHLLSNTHRLVHTVFTIKNVGAATLKFKMGYTLLQQVTPLAGIFGRALLADYAKRGASKTEYEWPIIGYRKYPAKKDKLKIDSGETERLHCDFIIPAKVKTIFVYSNACLDPKDLDLGWDVTSFYDLEMDKKAE